MVSDSPSDFAYASELVYFDEKVIERCIAPVLHRELHTKIRHLFSFLRNNIDLIPKPRKKSVEMGDEYHAVSLISKFVKGREARSVSLPQTESDPVVSIIMQHHFGVSIEQLDEAIEWHRNAMASENVLGSLLEMYIAENLEPVGWIWCSGETVRAVDFIYPKRDATWTAIQVKNRSNSENSSSSSVRNGTDIEKWHRFNAKDAETYWDKLNEISQSKSRLLSEEGFAEFVRRYIGAY